MTMRRQTSAALAAVIGFAVVMVPGAVSAHAARSGKPSVRHAAASGGTESVRVMTYNIKRALLDGSPEGGTRVAPWLSARKQAAAALIASASPDVIGVQEGSTSMGNPQTAPRQVDTLRSALGNTYGLARTENPPRARATQRLGVYIMYKRATFAAVGKGGHWAIGQSRWGVHQILRSRATGGRFLFVTTHLTPTSGHTGDVQRMQETQRLVSDASAMASRRGIPVVYVGDLNSHVGRGHPFNAPSVVMHQHNLVDSFSAAGRRVNGSYDTGNQYMRRPPRFGARIDYIFVPQSIHVRDWRVILRLRHGQFVGTIPSDHNPVVADLGVPIR